MRRALMIATSAVALYLTSTGVLAGPCEDGCTYNKNQCYAQAGQNYDACVAPLEAQRNACIEYANSWYIYCHFNMWLYPCNQEYDYMVWACETDYYSQTDYCVSQRWLDESDCNTDYENCLFACSVQNP